MSENITLIKVKVTRIYSDSIIFSQEMMILSIKGTIQENHTLNIMYIFIYAQGRHVRRYHRDNIVSFII